MVLGFFNLNILNSENNVFSFVQKEQHWPKKRKKMFWKYFQATFARTLINLLSRFTNFLSAQKIKQVAPLIANPFRCNSSNRQNHQFSKIAVTFKPITLFCCCQRFRFPEPVQYSSFHDWMNLFLLCRLHTLV